MEAMCEWSGTLFGVLGALLLAVNSRFSGWGFLLFLISNVFWIAFALMRELDGMLVMQLVFTATSLVGCWRWLVSPSLSAYPLRARIFSMRDSSCAMDSSPTAMVRTPPR